MEKNSLNVKDKKQKQLLDKDQSGWKSQIHHKGQNWTSGQHVARRSPGGRNPPTHVLVHGLLLSQHCRQSLRNAWCSVELQSSSVNELLILQRACWSADYGPTTGSLGSWTGGTAAKSGNHSRSLAQWLPRNTSGFLFPFNLWDVEVLLGLFLKSDEAFTRLGFFSPASLESQQTNAGVVNGSFATHQGLFAGTATYSTRYLHPLCWNSESYMSIR